VEIIGVASRDDVAAMEEFVARHDFDDVAHIADTEGRIWAQFGVVAQPAWVFVDGETGATERVLGELPVDDLRVRIEALAG
jgi:peroxiredoxin